MTLLRCERSNEPLSRVSTAARSSGRFSEAVLDFQDSSQEWRRLVSELLGTFFLVLVAAGGGMMSQAFPNTISRTAADLPLSPGPGAQVADFRGRFHAATVGRGADTLRDVEY